MIHKEMPTLLEEYLLTKIHKNSRDVSKRRHPIFTHISALCLQDTVNDPESTFANTAVQMHRHCQVEELSVWDNDQGTCHS